MRRWGPGVVVVALLAATAIAFATTERQKLEKTPFAVLHVTNDFSPRLGSATIELKLHHPHLLTVQIVDSRDRVVATLANEQRVEAGTVFFRWRGPAADGVYEPKITTDEDRVQRPDEIRGLEDAADEEQQEHRDRESGCARPQPRNAPLVPQQPERRRQPREDEQPHERVRAVAAVCPVSLQEERREPVADDAIGRSPVRDRVTPHPAGIRDEERND